MAEQPSLNITFDKAALKIGETAKVTFTFSAAPVGFTASDVSVMGGTFSGLVATSDPLVYKGDLTPNQGLSGSATLSVAAGSYSDTLTNPGLGASSPAIAFDTLAPAMAISSSHATIHAGETATITFTFSEVPVGFGQDDVSVTGGTLSPLQATSNPLVYTASFTPTDGVASGPATVSVANGSYTDEAGNSGLGGNSPSLTIQTARPTATIVVTDSALTIGEDSLVTFTFSEAVTGFTNADLTITNGTLSAVSSANGGVTWTATFTPSVSRTDATNVITLDMTGVAAAGSGNAGAGTVDSNNYAIDTARPTATITFADPALGIGQTSLVTFTFSEAVTGFTNAGLTIDNGTLSAVSSSDGGITWKATFTPADGITDTTNVIMLDMTGVADLAGNSGAGTVASANYIVDHQRPTATIMLADPVLLAGERSEVTFTFSEAVTGFTTADLTVPNGAVSGLSSSDGGVTWTGTYTPNPDVRDTSNLIILDNTGYTDLAGNSGTGTTDSLNFTIDTVRPDASILISDTALKIGDTADVTITFTEAVSGFTDADLRVANGTVDNLSSSDGGRTWTATLTPDTNVSDASNVVTLDMTGVTNAGGNTGVGTKDSGNYAIDTARPTATILVANAAMQAGQTSLVTITFSEAVSGFDVTDLSVANGAISGLASADGGRTWTGTLTPGLGVSDATNLIILDTALVTDAAGNAGSSIAISNNYAVGHVPPPVSEGDVISLPAEGGTVSAGAGKDSVSGAGGDDVIQGNTGDDTLSGGGGDDIVRGGQDNDFVHGNAGADLLFGDHGNDSVFGGQGEDFVQGGAGNDYVLGNLGRDTVVGGQGADTVSGGAGDDYLSGDLGDDVLVGGAGADLFNFTGGGGRDVVMDFSQADGDHIRIALSDAADFAALSARFVSDGGDTLIELSGQTIVLVGVAKASLTAADFVFG